MDMRIVLYLISLLISISTFEIFIIKKVNNRDNRLLPAAIAHMTVYEMCRVLAVVRPESIEIIRLIEDFTLLQLLFMIIPYMWDFFAIQWHKALRTVLLLLLLITDAYILLAEIFDINYSILFVLACCVGLFFNLAIWVNIFFRKGRTNEDNFYHRYFGAAIMFPLLGVIIRLINPESGDILVSIFFSISCFMVIYAIEEDYLVDQEDLITANIFETSDLILIILDTECSFIRANNTAMELLPRFIDELSVDPNNHEFLAIVRHYVQSGSKIEAFDIDGKYYETKVTPVYLKSRPRGFIITLFDVTNVAEKANRFFTEKKKAEAEALMKSKFLARMSHSLRSPLHTIIGLSDILLVKHGINRKNKDLIYHMKTAAGTLLMDVNEILEYSKLEVGNVKLNEEEYDLYDLIEDVAYQALINLKGRPVTLKLEYLTDYPVAVKGDKVKIKDMLINIVSNAVKFTNEGSVDIYVGSEKINEDDVRITVTVKDTGVGMTEEQLANAFKEYESYADTHAVEGTGLGLPIVQLYAKLMSGKATIAANEGGGTIVSVDFVQQDMHTAYRVPEILDRKKLLGQHFNADIDQNIPYIYPEARVLLADDFDVNLLIFEEIVKPWNLTVVAVKNGEEALVKAFNEPFDLIVLDQMMPVLTGIQAAEKIREFTETPIIIMTAMQDEEDDRLNAYDAKVSKPVNPIEFRETMERLLPEDKRVPYRQELMADNYEAQLNGRIKVLKSFVNETTSILGELTELKDTDMETFRTKVHGIKGTLRQIGRKEISDEAEIMEMAAKAGHKEFIDRKLNDFIQLVSEEIEDIKEEIRIDEVDIEENNVDVSAEDIKEYFRELCDGFKAYDLDKIDSVIGELSHINLTDKEKAVFEEAKMYADELEYEKGYEFLKYN